MGDGAGGVELEGGLAGGAGAGALGVEGAAGKMLVMLGTTAAGTLVLEMATPPSTRATMPTDRENINMQVTELMPRPGLSGTNGPDTSTSMRLNSAMTRATTDVVLMCQLLRNGACS